MFKAGIDIDNVLTPSYGELIKVFNSPPYSMNFKLEDWRKIDFWDSFPLTKLTSSYFWAELIENGFLYDIPLLPLCKEVLNTRNFDKYFITFRNEGLRQETLNWLEKEGLSFREENVFCVGNDSETAKKYTERNSRKANLAHELGLDLFIEDEAEVALGIANMGIPVILFNYPWNQKIKGKNIIRVGHWEDSPSYWKEVDRLIHYSL